MSNLLRILPLALALACASCSTTIGRIHLKDGLQDKDTFTVASTAQVDFWAHVNVKHEGKASIDYHIKVFSGEQQIGSCIGDALDHYGHGTSYLFVWNSYQPMFDRYSVKQQKKLKGEFRPPRPGNYRIEVKQYFDGKFLEVNRADLILRQ